MPKRPKEKAMNDPTETREQRIERARADIERAKIDLAGDGYAANASNAVRACAIHAEWLLAKLEGRHAEEVTERIEQIRKDSANPSHEPTRAEIRFLLSVVDAAASTSGTPVNPNPGSPDAKTLGCICPAVVDERYVTEGCPIHKPLNLPADRSKAIERVRITIEVEDEKAEGIRGVRQAGTEARAGSEVGVTG